MRIRPVLLLAVITWSSTLLMAQSQSSDSVLRVDCRSSLICPGEELTYEVSWMNVSLGQIRLKTVEPTVVEGHVQHNALGYVDSYEGLPFVDLHAIDHTYMDDSMYSLGFSAMEKKGDHWQSDKSLYDRTHNLLIIEKSLHPDRRSPASAPPSFDTLRLREPAVQDGLSILYFARANVRMAQSRAQERHEFRTTNSGKETRRRQSQEMRIPTVVYGKQGITHFVFQDRTEYEEIDAWKDKKIRVVPLEGRAEFEGLFGFTGDFKGWFTDDVAAIPIKAELKVLIGSVRLELIRWKREGWVPPE